MKYALYIASTGEFTGHGNAPKAEDVALMENDQIMVMLLGVDEEPPDGRTEFLSNDQRTLRPTLPVFSNPYDLAALPAGTIITVRDESGAVHEITDLSETLTLEGSQIYDIQIDPPFPWQPIKTTLEVT